jgi:predicted Zn-dependent protease
MSTWKNKEFNLNNIIKDRQQPPYSEEEINYIYNLAVKKCNIGDFQNALPIFQSLNFIKLGNPLFLKAAAGCLQNLEKYPEAFMHFQGAFLIDMQNNQDCLFYMAYCTIKMKKNDQAVKLLNQFMKDNPEHPLIKKAQLLLKGLQSK